MNIILAFLLRLKCWKFNIRINAIWQIIISNISQTNYHIIMMAAVDSSMPFQIFFVGLDLGT